MIAAPYKRGIGAQASATEFDGTDDGITAALGAVGGTWGPGTLMAILRPVAGPNGNRMIFSCGNDGLAWYYERNSSSAGNMHLWNGSGDLAGGGVGFVEDAWWFIAVSKAGGSATPRYHRFNFTDEWNHVNGTAGGDATIGTDLRLGYAWNGTIPWSGDIALLAVLPGELTDAQAERLLPDPGTFDLDQLLPHNPKGLWLFGQDHIVDFTGRGANETARTGTQRGFPTTNEGTPRIVHRQQLYIPWHAETGGGDINVEPTAATLATASGPTPDVTTVTRPYVLVTIA